MLDLQPYLYALIGVSAFCGLTWAVTRTEALMRCLLAVVAVWCVGYLYGVVAGDYTHWAFNILTDGLAAVLILRHPAGKMQAALGGTYAVQVAMHIAYGAREIWGIPDPVAYYEMLTLVAYAQLAILGGWCIGTWGGHLLDRLRHRRAARNSLTGLAGVGRTR